MRKWGRAIEDYFVMREACYLELSIMELNRVGVEKDVKNIIK